MLLELPPASYVNVSTIFVSSLGSNVERIAGSEADFRVRLPNYLKNVFGLELEEFSIPKSVGTNTDRNKIDFRLRHPSIFGGEWKTFELTLPETTQAPGEKEDDIVNIVLQSFASVLLADDDFGGKVEVRSFYSTASFLVLECYTFPSLSTPLDSSKTECELLFGTGVNKSRSAAPFLGFDEVDQVMEVQVEYNGKKRRLTAADSKIGVGLYRFLDVLIDEFSTVEPWYRIFISEDAIAHTDLSTHTRVFDTPILKANTLTFHLRLNGGRKPISSQAFYFNIKVLELRSTVNFLPSYAKRSNIL